MARMTAWLVAASRTLLSAKARCLVVFLRGEVVVVCLVDMTVLMVDPWVFHRCSHQHAVKQSPMRALPPSMIVYFVWRPVSHRWPAAWLPTDIGPHHPCRLATTSHVLRDHFAYCRPGLHFSTLNGSIKRASYRVRLHQHWSPFQLLYCLVVDGAKHRCLCCSVTILYGIKFASHCWMLSASVLPLFESPYLFMFVAMLSCIVVTFMSSRASTSKYSQPISSDNTNQPTTSLK